MRGHGWFSDLSATQKVRRGLAAFASVAILTPVCLSLATAETSPIASKIMISRLASREDAHVLDNTRVEGLAAIFFKGADLTRRVDFYLDDGDLLSVPTHSEYFAPYDFRGTRRDNKAYMFDFSELSIGVHSMTLAITSSTDENETAFETLNAYSLFYVGVDPPSDESVPTTAVVDDQGTLIPPTSTVDNGPEMTVPAPTVPEVTVPEATIPATTVPAATQPPVFMPSSNGYAQAGTSVSIASYGAVPNDGREDSNAIQAAINDVHAQGGGTVFFPGGEYIANEVSVYPGMSYIGNGDALLKRSANFGDHSMLFTSGHDPYSGNVDSAPMIFRGLILDGNSQQQGPYTGYQKEHSHLLYLDADTSRPGRLTVDIANMTFQNGVGDGIEVFRNVNVTVNDSAAHDVFRGGYVMTGGYSIGHVTNFTTTGDRDPTGIDMEVDTPGYGNTLKVELYLNHLDLDADFDLGLNGGSIAEVRNVTTHNGGFFVSNEGNGTINIYDSYFAIGGADSYSNRIIYPGQLTFTNVTFTIVRQNQASSYQYGLDVYGTIKDGSPITAPQNINLHDCRFLATINAPDKPMVGFHMQSSYMVSLNLNDTIFGSSITPVV